MAYRTWAKRGLLAALLPLSGCNTGGGPTYSAETAAGADWTSIGGTSDETHFSALEEITPQNVNTLGLAWSFDLETNPTNTTPLEVGGVMYVAAGYSVVYAIDAATGRQLWRYDPQAAEAAGEKLRYAWGIRGMAYADGRLYVGAIDGRLIALDAKTGKVDWSVLTVTREDTLNITGAPRIIGGNVIIGNGGADMGVVRGYVTAYDLKTGRQSWRFFTVPGEPAKGFENPAMAMAAKTWSGEWWKQGGGGTVWSGITYDKDLNTVYIGVGNGGPWNWKIRNPEGKDNLFLSSIVALDATTGAYKWHYQLNPNDAWDFSAAMDMILATLQIDGKPRKVLMQAPKNGFFYVLDRQTGKLISAEKIGKVTWADRIDLATGRPVERPNIRYENGPVTLWPSFYGTHNWQAMAFSPKTGLMYIPELEMSGTWGDAGDPKTWQRIPGTINTGLNASIGSAGTRDRSSLLAWNPVTQKVAWRVPTTDGQNPGALATAGGLVFHGETNATFKAYDAGSGRMLWKYATGVAVTGNPIAFSLKGRQYIAVVTSPTVGPQGTLARRSGFRWNYRAHPRRLLVFALGGKASLAPVPPHDRTIPIAAPNFRSDPARAARGGKLFGDFMCRACHGSDAIAGGGAPDLRESAIPTSAEAFAGVVGGGASVANGMPRYAEFSPGQLEDIRHYIRQRAEEDLKNPPVVLKEEQGGQ